MIQMTSITIGVTPSKCDGMVEMVKYASEEGGHCDHVCCKRSKSSSHIDDFEHMKKNDKKEKSDVDRSKPSKSQKDGCDCSKKTSSQSLFLSPKQASFAIRSTIYFKNKFTNPKNYHFDLNHSIFHPPRNLA